MSQTKVVKKKTWAQQQSGQDILDNLFQKGQFDSPQEIPCQEVTSYGVVLVRLDTSERFAEEKSFPSPCNLYGMHCPCNTNWSCIEIQSRHGSHLQDLQKTSAAANLQCSVELA